jgi:hypothetical protein
MSIYGRSFTQDLTIGQFLCKEILTDIFNKSVELWAHFHCHIKQSDPRFDSKLTTTVNTDLEVQQSLTCIDDVFYPGQKSTNKFISSSTTSSSISSTRPTTTPTKANCSTDGRYCDGENLCCEGLSCIKHHSPNYYYYYSCSKKMSSI